MAKPDLWDRIATVLAIATALFCAINGAFMTFNPGGWFELAETAHHTGVENAHFIRDIGLAFLLCAALLFYAAPSLYLRWKAALTGSLWLAAHAGLHIWEVAGNGFPADAFLRDVPGCRFPLNSENRFV